MEDYINLNDLDLERKPQDGNESTAGEENYVNMQGFYPYFEGKASTCTRKTTTVQTSESKRTLEKETCTESDYVNVTDPDNSSAEVPAVVEQRSPFSPRQGKARTNTTPKTTYDDMSDTLDGSTQSDALAPRVAPQQSPFVMSMNMSSTPPRVGSMQVTSLAFCEENAEPKAVQEKVARSLTHNPHAETHEFSSFGSTSSKGAMETLNVSELRIQALIAAFDRRLSTVWRFNIAMLVMSICAVVIAAVGLYIAMASLSGRDHPLQFRDDRTYDGTETNDNPGKNFKL